MDHAPVEEPGPEGASMNGYGHGFGAASQEEGGAIMAPSPPAPAQAMMMDDSGAAAAPTPSAPAPLETHPSAATSVSTVDDQEGQFVIDDDDDDDDILEEVEEVFLDEPEAEEPAVAPKKTPKKGRRVRSKAAQRQVTSTNQHKSYWSSDDDSFMGTHHRVAARPKRNESPAADSVPQTSMARPKNARSKRRLRHVQEDDDEGESSTDDEEESIQQQPTPPQRMAPPRLTTVAEKPPPVAVITTKKAKPIHLSPNPTKRSVSAANLNSSNSNLNNSNGTASCSPGASPKQGGMHSSPGLASPAQLPPHHLSVEDMEIMQRLDDEYENALEEREIGYMARYTSVRQSACLSIVFMLVFLTLGTTFFTRYADWSVHDSLLFSIYTITTVGYGNHSIPKETGFQCFTILYIFVGIATLTIMVRMHVVCFGFVGGMHRTVKLAHSLDR